MRIHIQNMPKMIGSPMTLEEWSAAAARAGLGEGAHMVSCGDSLQDLLQVIEEIEVLVASTTTTPSMFPATAPKLKLLFCTSAGLDAVPFDDLPRQVKVLNNSGVHGPKAGEFVAMALLMLINKMPAIIADQHAQAWNRGSRHAPRLSGKRLTVIGVGSLGGTVAAQAAHFGMHVTGVRASWAEHPSCDRVVIMSELDDVLPETDFLVLACPLTPLTRGILDRRRIALLPPSASVVNIGRGPLLDQDALCDALDAETVAGAFLDVFVPEPIPTGHRLWTTRNLVVSPHVSSDDPTTYNARSLDVLIENVRAFEAGRALPNLFDREKGY